MSNIFDLTKGFKEIAEWQHFAQAQQITILNLTKEINDLKEKNKQLEKLIGDVTPLINTPNSKSKLDLRDISDEEAIAIMELAKLREVCLDRELSSDETKRYDTYTKCLLALRNNKKKPEQDNAGQASEAQLLSIVKTENYDT